MDNTEPTDSHREAAGAAPEKVLAAVWILAALSILIPALMLIAVSDNPADRVPGMILLGLNLGGLVVAGSMFAFPGYRLARFVSLLMSAVWLVGAALIYPTQEFAADALWAAGVPALAALVTGGLALSLLRR